ncbi:MAG: DUF4834 family protein [Prevotella sp.]|nr:DUF4834 family protein [Prevotella sp.]
MFILKFLFFIFLIGLFAVLFFALRVYLTMRKMRDQFRQQYPQDEMPRGTHTTTETGETITDTRAPQRSNRKIIDDNEGEYVDFVEE